MHTSLWSRSIIVSPAAIIDTAISCVGRPWIVAIRNIVIVTFLCNLFMGCYRPLLTSLLTGLFVNIPLIIVRIVSGLIIFIIKMYSCAMNSSVGIGVFWGRWLVGPISSSFFMYVSDSYEWSNTFVVLKKKASINSNFLL